jgi:acetyl-CoA carboxylase biotin carboxyl carrier protein
MDLKKLEIVMKLMNKHKINELSLEDKEVGQKWLLKSYDDRSGAPSFAMPAISATPSYQLPPIPVKDAGGVPAAPRADEKAGLSLKPNQKAVKSPFVGTFYSAPSPDAEPFVKVGQRIKVGEVLCIVEAMKIMNEIESEVEGVVAEILVKNGQPVEYDQAIFVIE